MNYYIKVLQKYFVFNGRARRSEYWYFFLFNLIISFTLGLLSGLIGLSYLANIYTLIVIIPSIAVGVRRMHDVNKSGWYLLIPIYNLILALTESDEGPNDYGDDPRLDTKEYDHFFVIIMSFLMSAFVGCGSYAFFNETKIIEGFKHAETIKVLILFVLFITSFVFFVTISLTTKETNNPIQDNKVAP